MNYVIRWRLTDLDTDEEVILPLNPRQMSTPTSPRNISWAWGSRWGNDRMRGFDSVTDAATEWTFGGVLFTKAHYDLLLDWAGRLTFIRVQDHLGRRFKVVISRFDPVERLPTPTQEWRADYTITCMLIERLADA